MRSIILALFLFCGYASAQVVYDNATSGHCDSTIAPTVCTTSVNGAATVLTISHTTGSGSNRAIAIQVCVAAGSATVVPAISSVIYATSQTLTQSQKKFDTTGANYYCSTYALAAGTQPTSGTNDAVITLASTLSSNGWVNAWVITASGVDQTTTFSIAFNGAFGVGAATALTLSASGGSDLVFSFSCGGSDFTGTSQTERATRFSGGGVGACGSMIASTAAGGTTSLADALGSDSWIKIGGAFKAAAGGATNVPKRAVIL